MSPESVTLIERANIFNKTNHQNLFADRISTKKNIDIYPSQHLITNSSKQIKSYRTDKFTLPSIDKDNNHSRKKLRRPSYRTSLYHTYSTNSHRIDLSSLKAHGTKPEITTTIRDDDTIKNFQRHYAPPPSPSDDHIERLVSELNRTRQSTPMETDGNIPYRLPALRQSARGKHTEMNIPPKDVKSTLSNYLHAYY